MNFDAIRLGLAVLWLGVAVVAAVRPAGLGVRLDDENAGLIAAAALVLAVWNLSRWYFIRSAQRSRDKELEDGPLRRRGVPPSDEYHPELDFTKRDDG